MRALALILCLLAPAPGQDSRPPPELVATHYFYWYRWPGEHFNEPGAPGTEGHCRHFEQPTSVSYLSVDWHEAQFRAMASCGIDVALPVYWGAPGAYGRPGVSFARAGLPPMCRALARMRARGESTVRIGLFYDTSTLSNDVRGVAPAGGRPDLRARPGKELFCRTVVEFFEEIPSEHWARMPDGSVLVVLYVSGFAAAWDRSLGSALREAFGARFRFERVFLVADESWGDIGQDRSTRWGAALQGPALFPGVAQIGAGYDDAAVPGRHTPLRDREEGAFYRWSWQQVLRSDARLVLLETWNEMHEGTEICPTREAGTRYLELTREWIAKWRSGARTGPEVALRFPEPRPRMDLSWGKEDKGGTEAWADFGASPVARRGLREVACEDGPCTVSDGVLQGRGPYLYFQVSDYWGFDGDSNLTLEIELAGGELQAVEFDSRDRSATLAGAYTLARREPGAGLRFLLPHARLANRQNGGADFRLVVRGATAVRRVTVR